MTCPFCQPQLDPTQQIVFENEHVLFLQQPQPVLEGSGVIVPRAHRADVFELTPEEWSATQEMLHQVKALLDEKHQPQGYNVGWNVGRVGGQEIMHAHLHVIPRFADEPLAGKGIRAHIKQRSNLRPGK